MNQRSRRMQSLLSCLVMVFIFMANAHPVTALTMTNDDYVLQMSNLNTAAGNSEGANNKLGITVGETAPGLFSGSNFKVRSGFQYIHSLIPFSFTISNTLIDFGILSATNPVTRAHTLTVSNGSAYGYAVAVSENHQLLAEASGQLIPDTTCDNGSCNESTAAAWSSTLTYGFGYRCDNVTGTACASGFGTSTHYKQIADSSKSETAQAVMSNVNVTEGDQVQITYKVNISGTQAAGQYGNVLTFIATPTF
jgi:galactitol-specific phosphotransferase system IIB component